jgi:hypothetical protein
VHTWQTHIHSLVVLSKWGVLEATNVTRASKTRSHFSLHIYFLMAKYITHNKSDKGLGPRRPSPTWESSCSTHKILNLSHIRISHRDGLFLMEETHETPQGRCSSIGKQSIVLHLLPTLYTTCLGFLYCYSDKIYSSARDANHRLSTSRYKIYYTCVYKAVHTVRNLLSGGIRALNFKFSTALMSVCVCTQCIHLYTTQHRSNNLRVDTHTPLQLLCVSSSLAHAATDWQ